MSSGQNEEGAENISLDAIPHLDTMMSKVDQTRLYIFQIFRAAVYPSTPTIGMNITKNILQFPTQHKCVITVDRQKKVREYIENVGSGITDLQKSQTFLENLRKSLATLGNGAVSGLDEEILQRQREVFAQFEWTEELAERCRLARTTFEKKKREKFPFHQVTSSFGPPIKRRRLPEGIQAIPESQAGETESYEMLENIVNTLKEQTSLSLSIIKSPEDEFQPIGVCVQKAGVFQATILFREPKYCTNDRIDISRINVYGPEESNMDAWKNSEFSTFRQITMTSARALKTFREEHRGRVLRSLVKWLASYSNLYSAPCKRCSTLLRYESETNPASLPTVRTFFYGAPYHPSCELGSR